MQAKEAAMPKLLYARPPTEPAEEHKIRNRSGRGVGGGSFDVRHWQNRPLPAEEIDQAMRIATR
jgi:hypothetical protein